MLDKEPTVIIYTIQGILQALAAVALPFTGTVNQTAHVAIAVCLAIVGAILNRATVTPVS